MIIASQYARALYSLVKENPKTGKEFLTGLRAALKRRGHEKLLPQIFTEYKKLEVAGERRAQAQKVTPERERTRILFELYKKLIA
ncbi:MAG: hypothetical protein G01um101456_581 [Parcubacteria group bacterium Gr01-1014_56]|nr:MAG: hypothetical protein G01um101456_581 [Parcubacteria group bacterium Gr01-1014_56]